MIALQRAGRSTVLCHRPLGARAAIIRGPGLPASSMRVVEDTLHAPEEAAFAAGRLEEVACVAARYHVAGQEADVVVDTIDAPKLLRALATVVTRLLHEADE